jgi:ElaB/YqjD/DUF883 family membrane-anchored ribosome-binding protein
MTAASPAAGFQQQLASTTPGQVLNAVEFWKSQRAFVAVIFGGTLMFIVLAPYTYGSASGWEVMALLVVQSLAFWGAAITAKGLAAVQVENAIVQVIERRGAAYLRDIKSGQRSRIDLDYLEASFLPPNPANPAPAMVRLFQHICKEARDRKFESSVNVMQPYREEPLEDVFKLQNLQKIALWLGILGTFIGLLIAIGSADLASGNFVEVVQKMFAGLKVAFSASLAGLEVAVILGAMLLVLRKSQEHYFKEMESAVVLMLSLARNSINKDDYLAEFGQIRTTVDSLNDTVYGQTQEIKNQTEQIGAGMSRLVDARKNFDSFVESLGETQRQFIEDIRGVYDTISLHNLSDTLNSVLIRAGRLMGDKIEVGTTQITNRLTDFNASVDTLSKAMEGQARESAETAKKLATQINTATADNVAAIKGVLARIQETVVRDVSAKNELQDLSRRIGALTVAIEKIEYLAPRPRSIREYFMSLRW